MANVAVLNMTGAQVGTIELNDAIFGIEANEHVMHLAVVQYLANQRQGTQSTKTRAEVRGGGRKPYSLYRPLSRGYCKLLPCEGCWQI